MPLFTYQARDSTGQLVVGTLEAVDKREVAVSLSHLGYQPVQIQQQGLLQELITLVPWRRRRIDRQEVLVLFRALATLLRAGIPLSASLEGSMQQTQSPLLRQVLAEVLRRVQGGSSFSEALASHPHVFTELYVSMIRVGEVAGILDQVLERLAQLGTQELETRSRIQAALVYPLVLVGFAFLVVTGLLVGVLPKFVEVFQTSKIELPWPTRLLLGLSGMVRRFWWALALLAAGAFGWAGRAYATPQGRWWADQRLLAFPVVGELSRKITIARIARTLGAMLKTGVPLLEALIAVEKTVPNVVFTRALQQTRLAVAEGKSLSEPWAASGLFPPLVLQMVSVGERTGQLDAKLLEIAAFYDPEIELAVRNLTTLLEPLLLLSMGLVVGFIALSVLLPIFKLIHVFRR